VREAIARADLGEAETTLGRPHEISGVVIAGKRLGRTIGFPTCNLGNVPEMLPPLGIYAVLVERIENGKSSPLAGGALSIGVNPTTDQDTNVKVEVHLFDFDADLYGCELRLRLMARLRDEMRFDSLEALTKQIADDVAAARRVLGSKH
jgi:riboflavin kinase/FMN adenylyltransferase